MAMLLDGLNGPQKEAVLHREGPLVVFAGAGSGKTRVITTRVAYLLSEGVVPFEILAVTFTNKAAAEMRQRISALDPAGRSVHVATFHSACARWLREYASQLGFTPSFVIYDDKDSTQLLKKLLKEQCEKKELANMTARIKEFIQWAKTRALLPSEVEKAQGMAKELPAGAIATYQRYQEALASANAMDFADLLMNMLLLLRRNEQVLGHMQNRYQYIMVDEFQDTNPAQFELVMRLSKRHQNLCVVGDDDQSIYSWRGANPQNIMSFQDNFDSCKVIALEQNYRCSGHIVQAAAAVISNNEQRAEKTLFTDNAPGEIIDFSYESDGEMEAHALAASILREKSVYPFEEVAVFYRTNSQSRLLEEALTAEGVPYKIYGSLAFYDRMEVKDILAYLRLLVNEQDDVAFSRIVNLPPRGIGPKAILELEAYREEQGGSLMGALRKAVGLGHPSLVKKMGKFVELMDGFAGLKKARLDEVLMEVEKAIGYKAFLAKRFPEQVEDKVDNLHELGAAMAAAARRTPGMKLGEWLLDVTLDRDTHKNDVQDDKVVSLMTLHMAKGLEFDRVYIVGTEDGFIPHQNNQENTELLEEERRLFYVGITRARKKLSLLAAKIRQTYNKFARHEPSRFLLEIPKDILSMPENLKSYQEYEDPYELTYQEEEELTSMDPGQKVRHPTYGAGIIKGTSENFGITKVIVDFYEFGPRKISASQLKPIGRL